MPQVTNPLPILGTCEPVRKDRLHSAAVPLMLCDALGSGQSPIEVEKLPGSTIVKPLSIIKAFKNRKSRSMPSVIIFSLHKSMQAILVVSFWD